VRVAVLALVIGCGREPTPSPTEEVDLALRRGGAFLASRQSPDGGLRSRTYSALRDGWSVTPLAALALRFVPEQPGAYRRAVDFVATMVVGGTPRPAPEVSYPLHAYAIGALVLGAPDNMRHRAAQLSLIAAVRGLQLTKSTGWSATDVSYGGWGYAIDPVRRPDAGSGELPTANLSATVLAIGALVLGGVPLDDPALVAARGFVERSQNLPTDGGFVFSRAEPGANKAGLTERGPRSYGSMTADGVRSLIRFARPLDDPRVVAAIGFLDRTFDAARNPGEFSAGDEVRRASSYYYWAWSAAHAARHLQRRAWAEAIAAELMNRQHVDGSWRNAASEMREDDPLVATSFAIAALAIARSMIAGELRSHTY
jgi:hypothetical protein